VCNCLYWRCLAPKPRTCIEVCLNSSRILLVDDDRLLREVIGEFLASRGFEVDTAEDGFQALIKFSPGKYNLIMIDCVMKSMSGLQLMQSIQKRDPNAFCLIMTGYQYLEQVQSVMREGFSDYIVKPFRLLELLNLVKKYV